MLVFCHLFVGAAIGLALARATGDRRLDAAGLVAGILADLVDKPLGHLLFASTLDNGRLVAHSLGFLLVLLVAGSVLFRGRRPVLALVLALGVLSHQLLDAMWRDPVAWFFPLLGPFVPGHYPDYFLWGFMAELGVALRVALRGRDPRPRPRRGAPSVRAPAHCAFSPTPAPLSRHRRRARRPRGARGRARRRGDAVRAGPPAA